MKNVAIRAFLIVSYIVLSAVFFASLGWYAHLVYRIFMWGWRHG